MNMKKHICAKKLKCSPMHSSNPSVAQNATSNGAPVLDQEGMVVGIVSLYSDRLISGSSVMDFIDKCGISLVESSPQISVAPSTDKPFESGLSDNAETESSRNTLRLILIVAFMAVVVAVVLLLRKRIRQPEVPFVPDATISSMMTATPKEATPLSAPSVHGTDPSPTERWSEEINADGASHEAPSPSAFHEPDEL